MALPPKMASTASLLALDSRVVAAVSSKTAKAAAIEVFLVRAMTTLMSGGTTVRKAWGRTTSRSDWVKVRPMERAASAWPTPTALMPDRTASQKKAAW
jgi:urease alpha subunit